MFRKLSGEFVDVNREKMLILMSRLFKSPKEILGIFAELVDKAASNDEQRNMLNDRLDALLVSPENLFNT